MARVGQQGRQVEGSRPGVRMEGSCQMFTWTCLDTQDLVKCLTAHDSGHGSHVILGTVYWLCKDSMHLEYSQVFQVQVQVPASLKHLEQGPTI